MKASSLLSYYTTTSSA